MEHPIIYYGPTATLAGIPAEIRAHIGSFLPRRDVGTLQRTATITRRMTKAQLQSFCDTLPTEEELLEHVSHILEVRKTETISFYDAQSADMQVTTIVFNGLTLGMGLTHIVYTFIIRQEGEWLRIAARRDPMFIPGGIEHTNERVLEWIVGIPDPYTVARIVRGRKSCLKMHNETNSDMEYGVEMATNYLRVAVAPFFSKIVTNVEQLYDWSTPKPPTEQLKTIPDNDDVIAHQFETDLERVKILVWAWLQLRDPQQLTEYVTNWEAPEDTETIRIGASMVVEEYIVNVDVNSRIEPEREESEDKELPTHQEIIGWLKNELSSNRPINMRLFYPKNKVTAITSSGEDTLLMTSSQLNIYRLKRNPNIDITNIDITTSPSVELNIEKHVHIIVKELYGFLDPTTMLAIMKSREEAKNVPSYGEKEVQSYLQTVVDSLIHPFIEFNDIEELYNRGEDTPIYVEQSLNDMPIDPTGETGGLSPTPIWQLHIAVYTWLIGEPIQELFGVKDEIITAIKRYFRFYNELATVMPLLALPTLLPTLPIQQQEEEDEEVEELGGETAEEEDIRAQEEEEDIEEQENEE